MTATQRNVLLAALIVLPTILVYAPALPGEFVWDDEAHVTNNEHLRSGTGLWKIWTDRRAIPDRQNYPLTFTTFWVEYRLWGLHPLGYHLVNVLLHAASALLVWRILASLEVRAAWLVGALFALHPVEVESVAWISERKNTLSGLLYLGSILVYLRISRERPWIYFVSLGLFVLAVLAKTITCSLPAVLLILAWWRHGRLTLKDVALSAPFFALGFALAFPTGDIEKTHVGAIGPEWTFTFVERLEIAARAWWFYIYKVIWPFGHTFVYPRFAIDGASAVGAALGALAMGTLVALFALRHRLGRGPLAALLVFSVSVAPALGFFDVYPFRFSFVADHFQYLASLGTLLLLGGAIMLKAPAGRLEPWRLGAIVVLLGVLGALGFRQARAFAGPVALWEHTIEHNEGAWIAHNNLGNHHRRRGDDDTARVFLERAFALNPRGHETLIALADLHADRGEIERAKQYAERLIELPRGGFHGSLLLGDFHLRERNYERALEHFLKAIRLRAEDPRGYSGSGRALVRKRDYDQAIPLLKKAVELRPDYAEAHVNLGLAYAGKSKLEDAERHLRRAVEIDESTENAWLNLGMVYIFMQRRPDAIHAFEQAIQVDRGNRVALNNLARAYLEVGEVEKARATYQRFVETGARPDPAFQRKLGVAD